LLFAAHLPAWAAVASKLSSAAPIDGWRIAILTLSQLFFLLKVADVAWLRIQLTPRGWMAAALAVALVHAGAVRRGADGATDARDVGPWEAVVVFSVATLAVLDYRNLRRTIETTRSRQLRRLTRDLVRRAFESIDPGATFERAREFFSSCLPHRGPPVAALA
jgi:hypothetical protein